MLKKSSSLVAFAALIFAPAPARACEFDPFLFQLEGETEADAKTRSEKIHESFRTVEHYEREQSDFEKAERVFLGKVVAQTPAHFTPSKSTLPSTKVLPIFAFKGLKPVTERVLVDEAASGMCSDVGDGMGAWEDVGQLVVVFEGLPVTEYRPRGIDSFPVSAIRTVPLLDLLRAQGKDSED